MSQSKLSQAFKSVQIALKKHSPEILTGIGIAGMITSTVLAVRATPKALELIEKAGYEKGSDENPTMDMEFTPLTLKETVQVAWKCYIPSAIVGAMSVCCLIGASSVNLRRNAALATAYTLSESALKEYQEKVIETIGEKKEQVVKDTIAKDKIEKNPVSTREIIVTGRGETLCFDSLSGQYFQSDIDKLKKIVNELNRQMRYDCYISLNEFYSAIGLHETKLGNELGWNIDKGYIDLNFSAQLTEDGTPCLVIDYSVAPQYEYYR